MTNREIVESYIPMAKFLAAVLGPSCEVVLHYLEDLDHSLVYVANGELSGRRVGDGLVNFNVDSLFDLDNCHEDFKANVVSKIAADSEEIMRISSFFIRDEGKIIGFLGVNQSMTQLLKLRSELDCIMNLPQEGTPYPPLSRKAISAKNMIDAYLQEALANAGCGDSSQLTKESRKQVIDYLERKNIFAVKGCVNHIAKCLGVSVPTIYRYISEVKEDCAPS